MPDPVLQAVAGALAVSADQDAVATVIGVRLPALHREPVFTVAHHTTKRQRAEPADLP